MSGFTVGMIGWGLVFVIVIVGIALEVVAIRRSRPYDWERDDE